jgi:hypothetical protein
MSQFRQHVQLCRSCGARYGPDRFACTRCDVGLVDEPGAPTLVLAADAPSPTRVPATGLTFKQRTEVVDLLAREGVRHRWEGESIVAARDDADLVRELVGTVMRSAAGADDDLDDDEVGYELDDWLHEQQAQLVSLLAGEGIPHRWEGTEIVVPERFADRAEELIDDIDHPDAIPVEPDDDDAGGELLGTLFVAADVLARDPQDPAGVRDLIDLAEIVDRSAVPYGLDVAIWDGIRRMTGDLADLLGADADEEAVVEAARTLRESLREMV